MPVYGTAMRMQATILAKNVIVDSVVELIRVDVVGMLQTRNADRVRSDAECRFQMFRVHQKSGKFVAVFVQSEQNAKSYVSIPPSIARSIASV